MPIQPNRRTFLKSAGVSLALPLLESLAPAAAVQPKRLVCVGTYLGFHRDGFFPAQTGRDYETPEVLKPLEPFRDAMTVFSGLDHRGANGHRGWRAWMTGSAVGSVSADQVAAAHIGHQTRFDSLQITCGNPPSEGRISFTKEGVALPMIGRPSVLYRTLFRSSDDHARIDYLLASNGSVLDGVLDEANSLGAKVSTRDRDKLGEYFASVRDVEKKLLKQRAWLDKPTPKVDYALPEFDPIAPDLSLECETLMYDLLALALTTDSTRVATFLIPGWSQVFTLNGRKLSAGYHGLSHHGNDPAKIAEYNLVGTEHVKRFGEFISKLKAADLLDSTAVVLGSGMGDSNTHDNSNLPTAVIGGGFRHGRHHRIDRAAANPRLLGDLYLTLMQHFGIETEQFANAKSNLNEYLV